MTVQGLPDLGQTRAEQRRIKNYLKVVDNCAWNESLGLEALGMVKFDLNRGCWLFTGKLSSRGRPGWKFMPRNIYMAFRGPIKFGMEADHCCRVIHCLNPWHISIVTRAENLRRRMLTADEHWALRDEAA